MHSNHHTAPHYRLFQRSLVLLCLITASVFWLSDALAGSNLYRYKNDKGFTVMVEFLPEEAIRSGYQIVDRKGRLIESVAPAETDHEKLQAISAEQNRMLVQAAMQADRDKALRLRYSTVDEVTFARERTLSDMESRISILIGSRENELRNIESQQRVAANRERRGLPVPPEIEEQIMKLRAEVSRLDREIKNMQQRKQEVADQFDYDIKRVQYLLGSRR